MLTSAERTISIDALVRILHVRLKDDIVS